MMSKKKKIKNPNAKSISLIKNQNRADKSRSKGKANMKPLRNQKSLLTMPIPDQMDKNTNDPAIITQNTIYLNSKSEAYLNDFVQLASTVTQSPIAFIGLFAESNQSVISSIGLNPKTLKSISLRFEDECTHPDLQVIENIKFANDQKIAPWIQNIPLVAFYAKVTLYDHKSKKPFGVLCVLDSRQKRLNDAQISSLKIVAHLTESYFQETLHSGLAILNLAQQIAHDINTPLTTISLASSQIAVFLNEQNPNLERALYKSKVIEETVKKVAAIIQRLKSISVT